MSMLDVQNSAGNPHSPLIGLGNHRQQIPASPVNNDIVGRITELLNKSFGVDQITAQDIFDRQRQLKPGDAFRYPTSETLKYEILVTQALIIVLTDNIGAGTHTEVFAATVIATVRHTLDSTIFSPAKPQPQAVKRTKKITRATFTPENQKVKKALENGPTGADGLDIILTTFKCQGIGYCLANRYTQNLATTNFHLMENGVESILMTFISCLDPLITFHENNFVHRDLKPENILVAIPQETEIVPDETDGVHFHSTQQRITGAITDFGTLDLQKFSTHTTCGTPGYIDPSIFGPLEDNLIKQRERKGIQTKESEVYALGISVWHVLRRFISAKSKQTPVEHEVEEIMKTISIKRKFHSGRWFTDEELKAEGLQSNYRVMHAIDDTTKCDYLICYPELPLLRAKLKEACSKLTHLSAVRIQALIQLSDLACDTQELDLRQRPTMAEAQLRMRRSLRTLQPEISPSKSPNRRGIMRQALERRNAEYGGQGVKRNLGFFDEDEEDGEKKPRIEGMGDEYQLAPTLPYAERGDGSQWAPTLPYVERGDGSQWTPTLPCAEVGDRGQ